MKVKSTLWKFVFALMLITNQLNAQTAGDYRSNVAPAPANYFWSSIANWETFDGVAWVPAASAPNATSGKVSIVAGDSVILNTAISFDQVTVDAGGILGIFNIGPAFTTTLNNDVSDDDIIVNGKLYLASNATLNGTGTIRVNATGQMFFRNGGKMLVSTTNAGTLTINLATIDNCTLTNNGTTNVLGNTLSIINTGQFINNDSIAFISASPAATIIDGPNGTFINAATGKFHRQNSSAGVVTVNSGVTFSNAGKIKGKGEFSFATVSSNTGTIAPGNSPGTLIVNSGFASTGTPTLDLEISTTGGAAGINYDQVVFKNAPPTNLANIKLKVTDMASDAVGTVYTIISTNANTLTGTFAPANITLSPNLGNLQVTSTAVTVEKLSVLPLSWGYFFAYSKNNAIQLDWETIQEIRTASFEIEYSDDNRNFTKVASIPAKGYSNSSSLYSYSHSSFSQAGVHYYRIKQVDIDKAFTYSATRVVKLRGSEKTLKVQLGPNPITDHIKVVSLENSVQLSIHDISGRPTRQLTIGKGTHTISLSDLPKGTYIISVSDKDNARFQQKFIKQ